MPTYPNTGLTQTTSPFYGSCKVEVSLDNGSTWVNVGAARAVSITENIGVTAIQADNAPDLQEYVADQTVEVKFNGLEFYLPTLDKLRGGIDTLTVSSAGPTTRTDTYAIGAWARARPIWIVPNFDTSTMPAFTAVKNVKTGTTTVLTTGDDYDVITDSNNRKGLMLRSTQAGGDAKTSEALQITYSYGAVSKNKLTSGGKTTISSRWFKLTNKQIVNSVAKYRTIVLYSGSLNAGLNLAFKSANEPDSVLENPISIMCKVDATRTAGDQLFYIEDEVGI